MAIQTELTVDLPGGIPAAGAPGSTRRAHRSVVSGLVSLYRPRAGGLLILLAYLAVAVLLYAGWQQRVEWPLTAESGAGYTLGIVGGTLMLLLLLYPLRKHSRLMRRLGPVKYWFRAHMLFGVLGPVCILFHSGFRLGSLNSNTALFCMLVVASSGLIGRYFYTKIHHGLYGRKANLQELRQHSELLGQSLAERLEHAPWILAAISRFEASIANPSGDVLRSVWTLLSLGLRTWLLYLTFRIRTSGKHDIDDLHRSLLAHIGAQLASIRKVAEFHFYERLFALWHILHFPLFLMLILSGVVHVVAVHMY